MVTTKDQEQSKSQVGQLCTLLLTALVDLVREYVRAGFAGLFCDEFSWSKQAVSLIETTITHIKEETKSRGEILEKSLHCGRKVTILFQKSYHIWPK